MQEAFGSRIYQEQLPPLELASFYSYHPAHYCDEYYQQLLNHLCRHIVNIFKKSGSFFFAFAKIGDYRRYIIKRNETRQSASIQIVKGTGQRKRKGTIIKDQKQKSWLHKQEKSLVTKISIPGYPQKSSKATCNSKRLKQHPQSHQPKKKMKKKNH